MVDRETGKVFIIFNKIGFFSRLGFVPPANSFAVSVPTLQQRTRHLYREVKLCATIRQHPAIRTL